MVGSLYQFGPEVAGTLNGCYFILGSISIVHSVSRGGISETTFILGGVFLKAGIHQLSF